MKKIIVAAVAMVGSAAGAQAADLPVKAPVYKAPVAQVYDWTGFYVGANAGLGFGRSTTHIRSSFDNEVSRLGGVGALGGVQAGYNWQLQSLLGFNNVVLGVEADIQGTGLEDNYSCGYDCGRYGFGYQQKLDWFGTVRGRIGLATGPVLSYFTGGFAYGDVKTGITYFNTPADSATFSNTRTGWTIGSGVEAALGGNWTGKIEYLYLDLGTQRGTSPSGAYAFSSDIREHIFRVGVNYRIGGNSVYAAAPAANWAGFYVGGNAGGATALNRSSSISTPSSNLSENFNLSPDGFIGGVQAGYNFQAGNLVYGLEADFQGSTLKDDKNCLFSCVTGGTTANFNQKLQWFGTVRGRAGYTVGSTLFYATGGLAYGNVKTTAQGFGGGTQFAVSSDHTRTGYAVGGGIESPFEFLGLFGPNWTSKTEYLYVNLGRVTDTFDVGVYPVAFSTKVEQHTLRTGLSYHFDSPVVAKY
jgi:outer membrane immunogenic protein